MEISRSQKRRLYNAAARYANIMEVELQCHEAQVNDYWVQICVNCGTVCPCGNMEWLTNVQYISTKIDLEKHIEKEVNNMKLHHGWHHACYHKGLDDETPHEHRKLVEAQQRIIKHGIH